MAFVLLRNSMAVLLMVLFAGGRVKAGDWSHWRGSGRNDIVAESSGWKDGRWIAEKPIWQAETGEGCTSPLIVGGRLYVLGWKDGRDRLHCLEAKTGKAIWSVSYKCPRYGRYAVGDQNFYAGPTSSPEYDADTGYLYTLSCDGDLNCWDTGAKGKKIWSLNLYQRFHVGQRPATGLEKNDLRDYGYTTAPYVHGDWLIVEVGAKEGTLIAFDKRSGKRCWLSRHRGLAGHTGGLVPIVVEQVPCLAVLSGDALLVVRLDRGHEGETVAEYPWKTAWVDNILTPAVQGNHILISAYHTHHSLCKLEITLRGAKRLWEQPYASHIGSPVIDGDHIYMASERLFCLDWKTGKRVWEGGAYGYGGTCLATSDGKLIVWSERGRLTLVEGARAAPKKYKQLASIARVFAGTHAWPHLTLSDGLLYCKNRDGKLKCFSLSDTAKSGAAGG